MNLEEAMRKVAKVRCGSAIAGVSRPEQKVEDDFGAKEDGLIYSMGLSHASIHNHSRKPIGPDWVWISKASAAQGFGYPATRREVQRYGHLARRVRRLGPLPPLTQSFAEIVKENKMARRDQE